ncbi:MAG: PLP-dependent transferase [Sulfolobaceae archaeon]
MEGFNTKAVRAGEIIDERFGDVVTPIFQTSTFIHLNENPNVYLDSNTGKPFLYTRVNNPTINSLEIKYCSLEDARFGMPFLPGWLQFLLY